MSILCTPAMETLLNNVLITNFIRTRYLHAFMCDHVLNVELLLWACRAVHMHVPDLTNVKLLLEPLLAGYPSQLQQNT